MAIQLAIVDPGCPASTRYRIKQFAPYLADQKFSLDVVPWPSDSVGQTSLLARVEQAEFVVFQRFLPSTSMIREIRRRAGRMIYDFDDAVVYSESTGAKPRRKLRRSWRFREMVRSCDAVTAGNAYLAALACRHAPVNRVHVIPTAVELIQYLDSAPVAPATSQSAARPILGWIGSRSTLPYLERLRRPLRRLLDEVPDLTIRVIADQALVLESHPRTSQIEWIPWNADTEVSELQHLHVGLAPLPDDAWTRGKCGLRLLQYLAAGVPAVASPVGTQAEITGCGAARPAVSDDDWVREVRALLSQKTLASQLVNTGRNLIRARFDTPVVAASLSRVWCGL